MTDSDEHSSLLRKEINDGHKKFNSARVFDGRAFNDDFKSGVHYHERDHIISSKLITVMALP